MKALFYICCRCHRDTDRYVPFEPVFLSQWLTLASVSVVATGDKVLGRAIG